MKIVQKYTRTIRHFKMIQDVKSAFSSDQSVLNSAVKLLSKRWWIPTGARLEGPKLAPEGPRAELGFPAADQWFSSIQCTLFGFYGIK